MNSESPNHKVVCGLLESKFKQQRSCPTKTRCSGRKHRQWDRESNAVEQAAHSAACVSRPRARAPLFGSQQTLWAALGPTLQTSTQHSTPSCQQPYWLQQCHSKPRAWSPITQCFNLARRKEKEIRITYLCTTVTWSFRLLVFSTRLKHCRGLVTYILLPKKKTTYREMWSQTSQPFHSRWLGSSQWITRVLVMLPSSPLYNTIKTPDSHQCIFPLWLPFNLKLSSVTLPFHHYSSCWENNLFSVAC